jgi:hypothetical protein
MCYQPPDNALQLKKKIIHYPPHSWYRFAAQRRHGTKMSRACSRPATIFIYIHSHTHVNAGTGTDRLFLAVCMCIRIRMYVRITYACIHTNVFMYVHTYVCVYCVLISQPANVCMYACMHSCLVSKWVGLLGRNTHIYVCTYLYVCIYIYVYVCIRIYVCM